MTFVRWAQAAGAALVLFAVYLVHVWWYPYGWCFACLGRGKIRSRGGGSFRKCPKCKGKGDRVRWAPRFTARARARRRGRRAR